MRRMESLPKSSVTAIAAGLGCAAMLGGLLLGADAEGKGKKGGARVTSTSQAAILEAGAVTVKGGKGKVTILALADGASLGKVGGYKAKQGSSGKPKAAASKVHTAKLTDQGRQILGGCAADSLRAKAKFRKKNGKKGKSSTTTALDLDLGKCSVPSENPVAKPYKGDPIPTANADRCDFIDPAVCLQPWPNDYFTVADPSTDTGRRLNFDPGLDAGQQDRPDDRERPTTCAPTATARAT